MLLGIVVCISNDSDLLGVLQSESVSNIIILSILTTSREQILVFLVTTCVFAVRDFQQWTGPYCESKRKHLAKG